MTSQRFLNDQVNSRDFLRSLLDACKAPIVTVLFLSFVVIGPVAEFAKTIKQSLKYMELIKNKEIISYFGGITNHNEYSDFTPYAFLMILCGMAVALSLFSFAFKKNRVNVYFSVGLTRTRMFFNRLAAGTIWIFAVALIPYLTAFLMNIGMFGFHSHQLKLFVYFTLIMFVRGMSGFAIGALAAAVSGSAIEMVITTGATSIIALLAAVLLDEFKSSFLPGYVANNGSESLMLFSPWTGLLGNEDVNGLITKTDKKIPEEFLLNFKDDFFPIIFWIVAAMVIFAVALLLFKKRKNENAASFGKFAVASAINGSVILLISALILTDLFSYLYGRGKIKSVALCIILITVISFVIFFLAELIIRRNIKAVVRILPVYGGIAFVTLASLLVIGTSYFGTYNKLPEAKDIEYISMSYDDPLAMFTFMAGVRNPEEYDKEIDFYCKSSNPEDIKMCIEQFNNVKGEKREGRTAIDTADFVIKTKDGKFIVRTFPVYSEENYNNYNKAVFNSNYFHSIIKSKLDNILNKPSDGTENTVIYGEYGVEYVDQYMNSDVFFDYYNSDLLASAELLGYETQVDASSFEMTEELKNALYEELCNITYNEYYGNKGKPQGALVRWSDVARLETQQYRTENGWFNFYMSSYDTEEELINKTVIAYKTILVYPQMTKTAELLKDTEQMPHNASVKAVICPDQKLLITDAFRNISKRYSTYYDVATRSTVFASAQQSSNANDFYMNEGTLELFGSKPNGTYLDFIEIVYGANDVNVTRIDDKDKAQKISDEAYLVYNTLGDNGRCIFVIYDDGSVVAKYLPESSLSVLK